MPGSDQAHVEAQDMKAAYKELSQKSFNAWVMMMFARPKAYKSRQAMAKALGLSYGWTNYILRELKNTGYIDLAPGEKPAQPTTIVLLKRAAIIGYNQFIKMG